MYLQWVAIRTLVRCLSWCQSTKSIQCLGLQQPSLLTSNQLRTFQPSKSWFCFGSPQDSRSSPCFREVQRSQSSSWYPTLHPTLPCRFSGGGGNAYPGKTGFWCLQHPPWFWLTLVKPSPLFPPELDGDWFFENKEWQRKLVRTHRGVQLPTFFFIAVERSTGSFSTVWRCFRSWNLLPNPLLISKMSQVKPSRY